MAKLVYAWGQRRRLLKLNDLALYRFKIAKEDRRELPAEYRLEDFDKILRQFDPSQWGQWRPWALLTLLGTQGIRTNSARHLQWADVDLEDGTLAWRARWDKLGREWRQPLRFRGPSCAYGLLGVERKGEVLRAVGVLLTGRTA